MGGQSTHSTMTIKNAKDLKAYLDSETPRDDSEVAQIMREYNETAAKQEQKQLVSLYLGVVVSILLWGLIARIFAFMAFNV